MHQGNDLSSNEIMPEVLVRHAFREIGALYFVDYQYSLRIANQYSYFLHHGMAIIDACRMSDNMSPMPGIDLMDVYSVFS